MLLNSKKENNIMKILIFGAGCTGRGHLNALLYENGYFHVTFVDKNSDLVDLLKKHKRYFVRLLGKNERTIIINGFEILDRKDEVSIIKELITTDIIYTAVIAENLHNISEIIAKAISERHKQGVNLFLNIIACENLDNASSYLKKCTYSHMSDNDKVYCDKYVGFPDAMISRIVPLTKEDPLALIAEDYNEWVVRKSAFLGEDPNISFMTLVDDLDACLEKKLWIHNGGHATVAYEGFLKGYTFIHEAVADPVIGAFAIKVIDEIGDLIEHKFGFPKDEITNYKNSLVQRGSVKEMKDEILRVVRNPIRKLGINDRLLAPAIYAEKYGFSNENIIKSIVNVLKYQNPEDAEAIKMHQIIKGKGIAYFFEEIIGIKTDTKLINKIIETKRE
jgi:mannitol-1-phosphate 5-dehydrogenase